MMTSLLVCVLLFDLLTCFIGWFAECAKVRDVSFFVVLNLLVGLSKTKRVHPLPTWALAQEHLEARAVLLRVKGTPTDAVDSFVCIGRLRHISDPGLVLEQRLILQANEIACLLRTIHISKVKFNQYISIDPVKNNDEQLSGSASMRRMVTYLSE